MSKDSPIVTTTRALEQMVYHAVMEFAPWPMAEVEGTAHVVQAVNPAFCALLEKSEEELIGKPIGQFFKEGHATQGLLDRVQRSGEAATHVESAINTSGPIYWSYTCWPLQSKDERHVGLMIQVSETTSADRQTREVNEALLISSVQQHELIDAADKLNERLHHEMQERAKIEEALSESKAWLRQALDSADLGTWNLNVGTGLFQSDERFKAIFGVPVGGLNIDEALNNIHPDDRPRITAAVEAAIRPVDPLPYVVEYRVVHTDKSIHWVFAQGSARFSDGKKGRELVSFAGTVADITTRIQAEEALRDVDRHKSEFLATLAHELRNPLAPLRYGHELLAMSDLDQPTKDQAHGMMGRQIDNLVHLIDDLMDISRISRGVIDLKKVPLDLRSVLQQSVETSLPVISKKGHAFVSDLPDEPLPVNGDALRLTQLFSNVLNNAAKYTEPGGSVTLRAERKNDEVVVRVEDNGIGISKDQLANVFDMFAQVDRTNERTQGGLGIGLNIVKHLALLHEGHVEVHSDGLGKGSTFTISLPLLLEEPSPKFSEKTHATDNTGTGRKVLVVDDNRDAANMLAMILVRRGHTVRLAFNGSEGMDVATDFRPDVILLDIGLPNLNGYEVAKRIRQEEWGKATYLVALTGWGQPEDREKSIAAGFDQHVVKPVDTAVLLELLTDLSR